MKFNWGKAIILAFVLFISFIVYIVYGSMTTKVDLVTKDYYSKELRYQEDIDKQNNAKALSALKYTIKSGSFIVELPKELSKSTATGTLHFYRPSDAENDKLFKVNTNNGFIEVPSSFLYTGKWIFFLDISNQGIEYQFKETLFL